MTTLTDAPVITEPGVYDIPADVYHAQPALSVSGMKKLLPPSCPALFRYEQDHPQPPKREFDLGHAAHRLVLGAGEQLEVLDFDDYKTKAAQEAKRAAYAAGLVPLLPKEVEQVEAMAAAVRSHPLTRGLFDPDRGVSEQSLFWRDPVAGIALRSRLDWHGRPSPHGRYIVADYKTCISVDIDDIEKAIYRFGYHQQGAQYDSAVRALALAEEPVYVLVFQSKDAPYLVRVVQIEQTALRIGRAKNRAAIEIFRECTTTGRWPGYEDVSYAALPAWAEKRETEDYL